MTATHSKSKMVASKLWTSDLRETLRTIHYQIANIINNIAEDDDSDEIVGLLCQPYFDRLERIYSQEMPLARSIETSDIVLHFEGPGVSDSPKASLISSLIIGLRNELSSLSNVIAGHRLPERKAGFDLDLELSSFAQGGLYIGYAIGNNVGTNPDQSSLDGFDKKNNEATYRAIDAINSIVSCMRYDSRSSYGDICERVPDPRVRDAALLTVKNLCPTGRRGLDSVDLLGKHFESAGQRLRLIPKSRELVANWLNRPPSCYINKTIKGWIREIDLDARRFELRRIDDYLIQDIRCTFPEKQDSVMAHLLDAYVEVKGSAELADGTPRFMTVDEIKIIRLRPPIESVEQLTISLH